MLLQNVMGLLFVFLLSEVLKEFGAVVQTPIHGEKDFHKCCRSLAKRRLAWPIG